MTTREEIEAAAKRRILYHLLRSAIYTGGVNQREADGYTLADAFLAERAERQRRIEAAAREVVDEIIAMAERLMVNEFRYTREMLGEVTTKIITRYLDGETT